MTLKEEYDELWDLKLKIESKGFQKHIMEQLYKEIDKLKVSYDCKSLTELATLKGKAEGLKFLIKLLKKNELDLKNAKYELEKSDER
jgi:hypothetical protein